MNLKDRVDCTSTFSSTPSLYRETQNFTVFFFQKKISKHEKKVIKYNL